MNMSSFRANKMLFWVGHYLTFQKFNNLHLFIPGGPWIRVNGETSAFLIAFFWYSLLPTMPWMLTSTFVSCAIFLYQESEMEEIPSFTFNNLLLGLALHSLVGGKKTFHLLKRLYFPLFSAIFFARSVDCPRHLRIASIRLKMLKIIVTCTINTRSQNDWLHRILTHLFEISELFLQNSLMGSRHTT